ncbi:MAG: DNA-directed DNA polymerase II small subunit [Candidatus Micrarchaeota archaeon]|nr:DNA-directed DNA polymerase II small subunit [Candidatus Micrarchaeota archaeon]
MKSDIEALYAKGKRLTPDAYELAEGAEISPSVLERLGQSESPIISREDIERLLVAEEKIPVQAVVARAEAFKPAAKEYSPNFRILQRSGGAGRSACKGNIEDFVAHFRNRFERIADVLKMRASEHPIVSTAKLKDMDGAKARIVAMVREKRITKKGNLLLVVEDEEGEAKVVITRGTEGFRASQRLLLDDVVAFDGRLSQELFIADSITWPDIALARQQKRTEEDIAIAYLSDLHFGSKKFLEREFSRFVSWLNGAEGNEGLASKIKYIIIAGDVVDGIGIYPEQEKELAVKDIYKQYELFDAAMEGIPDYITVMVAPGNHDAVRRAEPQPCIPEEMMKSRVVRLENPSSVLIEGIRHLVYHGTSLDSIISGISGLSYSKPEEAMAELLKRRHLSPIYGNNLIVPQPLDAMVIDEEPDIVHMGHVHKNGYMHYRGSLLVNSGTFQDRTDFQIKNGHVPTPGVVPVLETKTGRLSQISFIGGE